LCKIELGGGIGDEDSAVNSLSVANLTCKALTLKVTGTHRAVAMVKVGCESLA